MAASKQTTQIMRYVVIALAALGAYNVVTGKTFWTIPLQMQAKKIALQPVTMKVPANQNPILVQASVLARPSAGVPVGATDE